MHYPRHLVIAQYKDALIEDEATALNHSNSVENCDQLREDMDQIFTGLVRSVLADEGVIPDSTKGQMDPDDFMTLLKAKIKNHSRWIIEAKAEEEGL